MSKRVLLVGLVGLNLALLLCLVVIAMPPAAAHGQGVAAAGNMLMVTAEYRDGHDALYLVDLRKREIYVFTAEKDRSGRLMFRDMRSLTRDFSDRDEEGDG